ncbi:uncharacterized protein K441DRAFT_547440, partial [Cenococcum geophilum 1.58]|uniref:uncharacterized protein n=1 Tax=Cenococcum geophilum 1.58 TaxID=794803 RepID=UPI00358F5E7B
WPRLSLLVITILLILVISNKPKQTFLGARYIILWERIQMGVKTLKWVECIKQWHQTKLSVKET